MSKSHLTDKSRSLRRNMTREEKHLWYDFLRHLKITVNRQKVIGNYIVDFYCHKAKLVIELDGSQHYENKGMIKDSLRNNELNELGILVIRYSDYEINHQFTEVCEDILKTINLRIMNEI
ncbi:MAG: endonuclease domain-containing protein [Eubacterium sp.]|nr:endonuclease domain-containing protein [Eubacterium sp.]